MFNKSAKTVIIIVFVVTVVIIFCLQVFKSREFESETRHEEPAHETDSALPGKIISVNTESSKEKEPNLPAETIEGTALLAENKRTTPEDLLSVLELPNPIGDLEIEMMLNDVRLQQFWKTQDKITNSWPDYLDIRQSLYKELAEQFDLNDLSNEDLVDTALSMRRQFWKAGDNRSGSSFRYAYMARILLELAHDREPENLTVTDELVETIQSTFPVWMFNDDLSEKLDNTEMIQLLLKLRSSQFEQIKTEVEKGNVPDWDDFVRANDLAYLLGKSKDYETAKKVTKWLIRNSDQGRWTAYLDTLEKSLNKLERQDVLNFNIYIVKKPDLLKELKYTRRLPSFKGPDWQSRGLIPVHEISSAPVWLSKEDLLEHFK